MWTSFKTASIEFRRQIALTYFCKYSSLVPMGHKFLLVDIGHYHCGCYQMLDVTVTIIICWL